MAGLWLWLAVLSILFALLCVLDSSTVFEDAYISFRYARNWAAGLGLVFDAGERVWGYSNFLWTLLLGLCARLGLDIAASAKALGLASSIACLWLCAWALVRRGSGRAAALLAPALLVASPHWRIATQNGLETTFYAALVLASLVLLVEAQEGGWRWPWYVLTLLGCALTRPDGPIFAALVFGFEGLRWLRTRDRRVLIRAGLGLALFTLGYGAFMTAMAAWYGQALPNPYYFKVRHSWKFVRRGFDYLVEFLTETRALFWLWPALFLPFWRRGRVLWLPALAAVGGYVAFIVYVGGDFRVYFSRFFMHILPLLAVLAVGGLTAPGLWVKLKPKGIKAFQIAVGCVMLLVVLVFTRSPMTYHFNGKADHGPLLWPRLAATDPATIPALAADWASEATFDFLPMQAVGMALAGEVPENAVVATCQCGQIPWNLPQARIVDLCWLMERIDLKLPPERRFKVTTPQLLAKDVDMLVLYQRDVEPGAMPKTIFPALLADPLFQENYGLAGVFEHRAGLASVDLETRTNMLVFLRRDGQPAERKLLTADPERLAENIRELRGLGLSRRLMTILDGPMRGVYLDPRPLLEPAWNKAGQDAPLSMN